MGEDEKAKQLLNNEIIRRLDNISTKEDKTLKVERQNRFAWFAMVAILFLLACTIVYLIVYFQNRLASQLSETTWIKDTLHLHDLAPNERRDKFRKMMIRILVTHGHTYRPKNVKAMSREQKERYIRLLYEGAEDFKFGYFDVPSLHKKESDYNPLQDGPYSERGIGQMKWGTALEAQGVLKTLPSYLAKKYYFELKKHSDLYDPIVATKATFVLLYSLRNSFKGNELWYISIYKWGGFLWKYFDNGRGQLPVSFTINDIEYAVAGYYTAWKTWVETFESGQLEPGHNVPVEKWEKEKKRMFAEEVRLNTAYKELKKVKSKLAKVTKHEKELVDANKELQKITDQAEKEFKKIYGEAKSFSGKDIRILLRKGRGAIQKWLKEVEARDKQSFYILWIVFVLGIAGLLIVLAFGFKHIAIDIMKRMKVR